MSSQTRLTRPGFGTPLELLAPWDRKRERECYPHAIADFFATPGVTLREQRMLDFINQITDKPRWWEKVHDEAILARWREEACGNDEQQETSDRHLNATCFDYCIDELRDKAKYHEKTGLVHVLDIDATVVKSDLETTDSFWQGLRDAVRPLEQVPERLKDWHPGSNGLVLDLLHPSLFPLQYGKSRVLPEGIVPLHECTEYIGKGEIVPIPTAVTDETTGTFTKDLSWGNSHNLRPYGSFQWLPSDVSFRPDGTAKIDSYVNNLHPQDHGELYSILEQAVSKAVPLWNDCLVQNGRIRIHPYSCGYETFVRPARFDEDVREHTGDTDSDDDIQDEDNWAREERFHDWIQDEPEARLIHQPFPFEKYVPMDQREIEKLDVQTAFPGGLQVIFKLANIELDPAGPTVDGELSRCEYNGSNFHVEGALNEHIAATALFYYDQRNVTDSYLEFRQQVDAEDMVARPEQHEYVAAERLYGIKNEEAAIQNIGKVLTKPGRLLAFPNVLQHKVGKFSLQDQTAGHGYRKILAMFLVDPHIRILSTANVPPQRLDWWADEVRKADRFSTLPVELFDRIMEEVEDFPISWAKACEDREVLMAERGRITEQYDEAMSEDTFYFCEH